MGYIRHHAIVVTAARGRDADLAQLAAIERGCRVSDIVQSGVNGYASFFVAPDGSKEGWEESEHGDAQRASFVEWLRAQAWEDGSSPFAWAELRYGDDGNDTGIEASSDDDYAHELERPE